MQDNGNMMPQQPLSNIGNGINASEEQHIKRPMNGYILFSRAQRRHIRSENPNLHNYEISKLLGIKWKNLPAEEKNIFLDEAKLLKEEHKRKHPDYKFRPRRKTKPGVKSSDPAIPCGSQSLQQTFMENPQLGCYEDHHPNIDGYHPIIQYSIPHQLTSTIQSQNVTSNPNVNNCSHYGTQTSLTHESPVPNVLLNRVNESCSSMDNSSSNLSTQYSSPMYAGVSAEYATQLLPNGVTGTYDRQHPSNVVDNSSNFEQEYLNHSTYPQEVIRSDAANSSTNNISDSQLYLEQPQTCLELIQQIIMLDKLSYETQVSSSSGHQTITYPLNGFNVPYQYSTLIELYDRKNCSNVVDNHPIAPTVLPPSQNSPAATNPFYPVINCESSLENSSSSPSGQITSTLLQSIYEMSPTYLPHLLPNGVEVHQQHSTQFSTEHSPNVVSNSQLSYGELE